MTGAICGGPEPATMKACYGGCYEWCISRWCATAVGDLSDRDRRKIRRFQVRCGGFYADDLRELSDFDLSSSMVAALIETAPTAGRSAMVDLPKRAAKALVRRRLIWESEGQYHISGAGHHVLTLAQSTQPSGATDR